LKESSLLVRFCKGVFVPDEQTEVSGSWAETPFGILTLGEDPGRELQRIAADRIVTSEEVAVVDLAGAAPEAMEHIVWNILGRGLLDKPGIASKGDAVLFVLVNEVLHELEAITRKESQEDLRSPDRR
jgi:hypothetical protein